MKTAGSAGSLWIDHGWSAGRVAVWGIGLLAVRGIDLGVVCCADETEVCWQSAEKDCGLHILAVGASRSVARRMTSSLEVNYTLHPLADPSHYVVRFPAPQYWDAPRHINAYFRRLDIRYAHILDVGGPPYSKSWISQYAY